MNILELPFNRFVGVKISNLPQYLLKLDNYEHYRNHLGYIHASAQYTLAEATSAHFLFTQFIEYKNAVPEVRRSDIRYKKQCKGPLYSNANIIGASVEKIKSELTEKNRVLINIQVEVYDAERTLVSQSEFEWFIQSSK